SLRRCAISTSSSTSSPRAGPWRRCCEPRDRVMMPNRSSIVPKPSVVPVFYNEGMFHQVEAPRVPDALDLVADVADMEAAFAAQRFQAVDAMRREAQAEAARHGRQLTEVIDRSIRLELAA